MKKIMVLAATMAVTASMICGCSSVNKDAANGSGSGKSIFKIDHQSCSVSQARIYLLNYQNIYGKMYEMDVTTQEDKVESFESYIKEMTLSQLAQTVAMAQLAQERELSLSEQTLESISNAAEAYYESLTDEEINYTSATKAQIEEMYQQYALANLLYSSLTESVSEEVSDNEARVMKIHQIYVTDEETANTVSKKLEAGGDFDSVAATYTQADSVSLEVRRGDLPQEVEDVAFEMEDGDTSSMIETSAGYYFVYCENHYLKEETDNNKQLVVQERKTEAFESEYHSYLSSVTTKLNESVWDQVEMVTGDGYESNSFFTTYSEYCE
ncbi:peptidylprolyl isomerase [Eubacterium oxidoreducens]|uniref:peptidylprolyl isomerase n=1 Tax=Eubacterium oxidoreducens TaxID=1732 RepID=A0A1G6BMD2_EUBOX|nr:peptidyl-prolyl cis-trans isomerase [Eubacterium oxidoreducens]SDB21763.1 foldase protein PrsA [Eubacterium oxidoreducens]